MASLPELLSLAMQTPQSRLRALIGGFWLFIATVTSSCGADDFLDSIDTTGTTAQPSGGVDCYQSFHSFKSKMKRDGKGTKEREEWHHIVEQNPTNKQRFPDRLQCTDNLIKVPKDAHESISGHYSSKQKWTDGKTVREVISARSWEEQREYGLQMLRERGITP